MRVAPPWALLDDAQAAPDQPRSRLYTDWVREHRCTDATQLPALWQQVQADQRAGLHALVLIDYEWGEALVGLPAPNPSAALRVHLFGQMARLTAPQLQAWLAEQEGQPEPAPACVLNAAPELTPEAHAQDIAAIHEAIRAGQTYQVNHTHRWRGEVAGTPLALYRRLRSVQPVAYGALIALPAGPTGGRDWVLSLSPELFLRVQAGQVQAQPMKGTAPRSPDPATDAATATALAGDTKNRAENLMIVDLLRNDLGRIAQVGSVRVPALFEVQALPTVFQMTSTVQARPLPEVDVPALLRATFPCGSITGAPKRQTMGLIRTLERSPRGLYCGAIGWVDAPPAPSEEAPGHLPELCLSVAIRTLELHEPAGGWQRGRSPVRWGVGGGIVLDSRPADEWAETHWKARFVFAAPAGFELIETLRREPDGTVPAWPWHLARLRRSAQTLGWPLDEAAAWACVASAPPGALLRLRLTLAHDGRLSLTHAPLPALALPADGRVRLGRAAEVLPGAHALSCHKTTVRAHYDAAVRQAEQAGQFDALFFNTAGELVEGGRSNVFVRLNGRWYTPPEASGALPGVMRAQVLADPAWQASERPLREADLAAADALMVCNALRGCLPAVWEGSLARG